MLRKNLDFERKYWKTGKVVAGTDEVGLGSLAGPIVVAVVVFPINYQNILIQDSKRLTPYQRLSVFESIKKEALEISIVFADVREIEEKNPLVATTGAMSKAFNFLKTKCDILLVDGIAKIPSITTETENIIKGDQKSISIAAASIIAKVTRDNFMKEIHNSLPVYNWHSNKGYFEKKHLLAILECGLSQFHRINYEPAKSLKKNISIDEIKTRYSYLFIKKEASTLAKDNKKKTIELKK